MISRTPQEIADFFGSYLVRNKYGDWYLISDKPEIVDGNWVVNRTCEYAIQIDVRLINVSANHDWTTLYSPKSLNSDNKDSSYYPEKANSDNKDIIQESQKINEKSDKNCQKDDLCPHSGEVYTHKEYVLAEAKRVQELTKKVNVLLVHGWKPQGGIFVEYLPESDGYAESTEFYYQAMVRGL